MDPKNNPAPKNKINLALDLRVIILLLLAVIAAMLIIWKPWSATVSNRTVQVTGEAKVTAKPDEFVFSPTYEFKNTDKDAALAALTKKSQTITDKLKQIGVADSKIKTSSSGYDYPYYYENDSSNLTYNLQLTITVDKIDLAQKVQDYLITTNPTGAITPQANFSDAKRKELEDKARDEATKEARKKAEQMADNLGFKIGKVKSVSDSQGFGILPVLEGGAVSDSRKAQPQLTIHPGENDLNYSVTVVYYIR